MICSLLEDLGVSGIKLSDTMAILEFTTTEKMFWWGMIIIVEQAIQKNSDRISNLSESVFYVESMRR